MRGRHDPLTAASPSRENRLPSQPTRGQRQQRQGIAGIGQEDIGQGIHEGHPGHPDFPVQGGGDVEVLAKGKAEVNGAELRRPGDEVAQNQEGQGPAGPQVPDGDQQVSPQKDEHIGPQPDGARQEPQKVGHTGLLLFRVGGGAPAPQNRHPADAEWFDQKPYHKAGFTVNRAGLQAGSRSLAVPFPTRLAAPGARSRPQTPESGPAAADLPATL